MYSKKIFLLFLLIAINIGGLLVIAFRPETVFIVLAMMLWLDLATYCFFDIQKRIFLFVFLVSFFVFLMGRELLEVFGLHTTITVFSDETNMHAERLLFISLLTLLMGYIIAEHVSVKRKPQYFINYESDRQRVYRQISLYIYYFSLIFSAIQLVYSGLFILRHGYLATYTSSSYGLPWIIEKLSDLTPITFFLFLSTMPDKRQTDKHSVVFIIYLMLTILSGKRFTFVSGLLILVAYYTKRNSINSGNVRWLNRKTIMIGLISIPILSIVLYVIGNLRFLNDFSLASFGDAISDLLYGQGVSIHVIKFSYQHEYNPDRLYTFSSTMTFLQRNFISRLLGVKSYTGNTVENALYGNSLGHANSYYVYGSRYLAGRGTGSCYIAEVFHDFGYGGVIIVNFIYGVILNKFFKFENMGFFRCTISLILLQSLLFAPRGAADGFVADIVDVTTWGTFLIVIVISDFFLKRMSGPQRNST